MKRYAARASVGVIARRGWRPGILIGGPSAAVGEAAAEVLRRARGWRLAAALGAGGWHAPALAALLALFAVTAAQSAGRPFLFDEANFLFQARAVAETGVPYANMGYMGDRGQVTTREYYGLWHPPLYLYLLGLDLKLFGSGEPNVRLLGVALMLCTALLVYGLGRTVAGGGGHGRACGLLATALFLASPLVVQSAVVVDIDGTLLLLVVTGWALLYLRWERTASPWRLGALGALLALALWTKLTTPLGLVGVVAVYHALAGRWRLGLRQAAIIAGVGVPLFLGTWGIVAAAAHLPFEMPFQWTAWELFDASRTRGAGWATAGGCGTSWRPPWPGRRRT
ncbi:MAG TPA: glycosyltransferase family 39 protein [Chloroflexota bacterium]